MADIARLQALQSELTADPDTIGYTGDDDGDLALLVAVNRTVDVETLSGSQLFEAIDNDDWDSRTANQQAKIQLVISLGDNIQIASGTKARAMMQAALADSGGNGIAQASLDALGVIGTKLISRAEELGLGSVHLGDVQNARTV